MSKYGEILCCFFDQALSKPATGNNFKKSSLEDGNDETPTSVEINFLHKIDSAVEFS